MFDKSNYVGRFAPSPTGPLHFGSMVAAIGSYLRARSQGGAWLLRVEDIDPPRETPGAAYQILKRLEEFNLYWDGDVLHQSHRTEAYLDALSQLRRNKMLYTCGCTRKEINEQDVTSQYGPVYTGACREGLSEGKQPRTLRVITHDTPISFKDAILGTFTQQLESEFGDFVVRRADDLFAYQLAVVVDDAEQGITEVVRGCDLLDNTPRQIHLQHLLNLPTPSYAHLPIALNQQGQKLSKQTGAASIEGVRPQALTVEVMRFLGLTPPNDLTDCTIDDVLLWGIQHWDITTVPTSNKIITPSLT
ncbi:tRNA glutamyl-Q(34) synthetase GluQRS [Pseudomonadota bacterium]